MGRANANERRQKRVDRKIKEEKKVRKKTVKDEAAARRHEEAKEDDLEAALKELEEEQEKLDHLEVTVLSDCTPLRCNGSFLASPTEKDVLLYYGGEYFDGSAHRVYGDLLMYDVKKQIWKSIRCPRAPAPRSAHAAATRSSVGGVLYVFGGEFASRSGAQFRHYGDLWAFYFSEQRWEMLHPTSQVSGPSPRSGHRMLYFNGPPPMLVVLGGFFDNARGAPRYFNDVHVFDLDALSWKTVKFPPTCILPEPRSAFQVIAEPSESRLHMFGGYSSKRAKQEVDRGHVFDDFWRLEWSPGTCLDDVYWTRLRPSAALLEFGPRAGVSMALSGHGQVVAFGGVQDLETDDTITAAFCNDLVGFNLEKEQWYEMHVKEGQDLRRFQQCAEVSRLERARRAMQERREAKKEKQRRFQPRVVDGQSSNHVPNNGDVSDSDAHAPSEVAAPAGCWPSPRMKCGMVIKGKLLYLYGGLYEDHDRQKTFGDMYCLDLAKLDAWKLMVACPDDEWHGESSSDESSGSSESEDE